MPATKTKIADLVLKGTFHLTILEHYGLVAISAKATNSPAVPDPLGDSSTSATLI